MHSDQQGFLADLEDDPLDDVTRALAAVTKKRMKTEADHREIARIEFMGGLYYNKANGVHIPGDNIATMVRDGGKLKKRGAAVQRAVECMDFACPLIYEGPRTPEALWDSGEYADIRTIKNGSTGGRTPRCRPRFSNWSVSFRLFYDPAMINLEDLRQCLVDAGTHRDVHWSRRPPHWVTD